MSKIIQGTMPYRLYDVPMLLNDKKYWANAEVTIEYTVTRDPSSGGDFSDWDVSSYDTVNLYNDDGDPVPFPNDQRGEILRKILYQIDEEDVVYKTIQEALDFT